MADKPPDEEQNGPDEPPKPAEPEPETVGAPEASKGPADTTEVRIKQLKEERDRLKAEVKTLQEKFLRARADYENYAKRAAREQQEAVQAAKAAALIRVAEVTESLEKAVAHAVESGAEPKGLRMVVAEYWKILKDEGLRSIDTEGVPFNYRHHMAVERTETDEHEEGTILGVYQRGYLLDDKVLRPAMVRVAVPPTAKKETPAQANASPEPGD